MRQQLQSLSHQQAMLLLTLITLGGEDDLSLLAHLPPEMSQPVDAVGRVLCQTPRKQILPQLVKEIKHLITESQRSPLDQIDPEWLAEFLLSESPRVISATLQQFPRSIAERIITALPIHLQRVVPATEGTIHPDLIKRIRLNLSEKIPVYTQAPTHALTIESLALLNSQEIMLLLREFGLRELAIAFRGVGRGPLTELCRRLGAEEAERLLAVIRNLPPSEPEETKAAQRTIRAISLEHRSKSEIIEEAGLSKLHQAIQDLDKDCQHVIAFNLPRRIGKRIQGQQNIQMSPQDLYQLKLQVLHILQHLSAEGQLSPHWAELPIELAEPPPPPEPEAMIGESMSASEMAEIHADTSN